MSEAQYSHDETMELIARAKAGEEEAFELLVRANAALVKSIVRKFINRGAEYDDLYQIGSVGLIKAIRNFDTSYSVRFSTYAVPMIAGEIKRFLRDDGMVKVSRSLKETAAKAAAAKERLIYELGREPGVSEIAAAIDQEPESVAMALEAARTHVSIYEPVYEDDSESLVIDRVVRTEDESACAVNRVLLKELLGTLSPRERQLIMLRFFADKTQGEIAKLMGVSQVQVSRLEGRILEKLREKAQ